MIDVSNTGRNLISISVLCTLLVVWLGTRYVSDAHLQLTEAKHLQRSATPETTLYKVIDNLEQQRKLTQQILIESTKYDQLQTRLEVLQTESVNLVSRAQEEIFQFLHSTSSRILHRYSAESTIELLEELEDKLSRLSFTNGAIIGQVFLPDKNRDDGIRMQLYTAHTELIATANQVLARTQALPQSNYTEVLSAYELKEHIWTMSDSVNQTSILLKSLLKKNKTKTSAPTNKDSLSLRIIQQQDYLSEAFSELTNLLDNANIEGISLHDLENFRQYYKGEFTDQINSILRSHTLSIAPKTTPEQWEYTYNQLQVKIDALKLSAIRNTQVTADSMKRQAIETLCLNAIFLLVFIGVAFTTFKLSKNIQHKANHDELTGLPNRRYFFELLQGLVKKSENIDSDRIVLMSLDLQGFKAIGDSMGNVIADKLLKKIVQRILTTLDENMIIASMGGDDFAIAYQFDELTDPALLAQDIRGTFIKSFNIRDALVKIDISIGYSVYPDDANSIVKLTSTSDFALFNAKQSNSSKIQHYDKATAERHENRMSIEKDLVVALEKNEFELYYQPQFNLEENKANAVEALIRWNHPTRGLVSPIEFIEIAEDAGLMPALGNWVLKEACRQVAEWSNYTNTPPRVAINVSVHQLMQSTFVQDVIDAIETHGVSSNFVELEITESVVMSDIARLVTCLKTLKDHGFAIALDDFGTGYSSLSQLQKLPLDTLKIDRSFIKDLGDTSSALKSVTTTIASIAAIYNLNTVAEGVENEEQLIEVKKLGIDVAQGYYYSKPVSRNEVLDTINHIDQLANNQKRKAA